MPVCNIYGPVNVSLAYQNYTTSNCDLDLGNRDTKLLCNTSCSEDTCLWTKWLFFLLLLSNNDDDFGKFQNSIKNTTFYICYQHLCRILWQTMDMHKTSFYAANIFYSALKCPKTDTSNGCNLCAEANKMCECSRPLQLAIVADSHAKCHPGSKAGDGRHRSETWTSPGTCRSVNTEKWQKWNALDGSRSYLKRNMALIQVLTRSDGSRASLLIQDRADILVMGLPSFTVILQHNVGNRSKQSYSRYSIHNGHYIHQLNRVLYTQLSFNGTIYNLD